MFSFLFVRSTFNTTYNIIHRSEEEQCAILIDFRSRTPTPPSWPNNINNTNSYSGGNGANEQCVAVNVDLDFGVRHTYSLVGGHKPAMMLCARSNKRKS